MKKDELKKVQIGDTVVMSKRGKERGLIGRAKSDRGIVTRTMIRAGALRVQRDGLTGDSWYAREFWELRIPNVDF